MVNTQSSPSPIIIDTDGGVDDALAIIMALNCDRFDLKAVTVLAGNIDVHQAANNVLRVIDIVQPEHRFRYITAKEVISRFRKQLKEAIKGKHHRVLFTNAPQELKGDIRYIFDGIDSNNSGSLSLKELSYHFQKAGNPLKQYELNLVFSSMDVGSSGEIDFE
ncbi:MAG: nucleoside hydrolase [Trichodesmium sp. MO_231.B1]|nr:nucleoside hydrolase [Trichodesmium sp. MO_231.B1]